MTESLFFCRIESKIAVFKHGIQAVYLKIRHDDKILFYFRTNTNYTFLTM